VTSLENYPWTLEIEGDPEEEPRVHTSTCPICLTSFKGENSLVQHYLDSPSCDTAFTEKPQSKLDSFDKTNQPTKHHFRELHDQWKQEKRASRSLGSTAPTINCNSFPDLPSCQDHPTFRFWHKDHGYVPFHCGTWSCSSCAPVKVENIASLMVKASLENDLTRHLALTLDPKRVQGDPWIYLQRTWNKMRVYLWRLSKKRHRRMKWQKVVQIQPGTGLPHYHLMVSQYIPFKWVMKAWKAVGGGGVYIRYVKIDTVSGFIKGYFTRQILGIDFPSRKRRYSCSRNISLARPKQAGWEIRQWISAPAYSKKGYVTGVEREDFVLPPSAFLSGSEEPPGLGDLQQEDPLPNSAKGG